ncbi:MAG TPA: hypothetical protein DER60_12015 [Syntrophomonas sp.]|jgi:hypothetical protein|nr:hypothetical protein [Syntrophomonas sp.]
MEKIDLKKQYSRLYNTPLGKNILVRVPAFNFLMINGQGDPNTSPDYKEAVEALYSVSYALKFQSKKESPDYTVMPLEGLWYGASEQVFLTGDKDNWQWTMMIMQPPFIEAGMVEQAKAAAAKKKPLTALPRLRFESFEEGLAAQVMYVGPYSEEHDTIMKLHQFIGEQGYSLRGYHHEIYLNDPRKTTPARLKTIIRQPAG